MWRVLFYPSSTGRLLQETTGVTVSLRFVFALMHRQRHDKVLFTPKQWAGSVLSTAWKNGIIKTIKWTLSHVGALHIHSQSPLKASHIHT